MLDHVPPTVFWPLFFLAWLALGLIATYFIGKWVDSNNPLKNARSNTAGRRRMATDWERPGYLPKDWT